MIFPFAGCLGARTLPQDGCGNLAVLEEWYDAVFSENGDPESRFEVHVRPLFQWKNGCYTTVFSGDLNSLLTSNHTVPTRWWALSPHNTQTMIDTEPGPPDMGKNIGVIQHLAGLVPKWFACGERLPEYGWWSAEKARRPVVLADHVHRERPRDKWEACNDNDKVPEAVLRAFTREVHVYTCDCQDAENNGAERKRVELQTEGLKSNITIAGHFSSAQGVQLWALRFREGADVCDNWFEPEDGTYWFVFSADSNTASYLGGHMSLVDHGDFNDDNQCEFLFRVQEYNKDGYKIFWNDFNNQQEAVWCYH